MTTYSFKVPVKEVDYGSDGITLVLALGNGCSMKIAIDEVDAANLVTGDKVTVHVDIPK